jgi:hypothetical protein
VALALLIQQFMKYQPLKEHLLNVPNAKKEVTLTFPQVEAILGFELPKSAVDYRQWWGNQQALKSRPQAEAWLEAGFRVDGVQLRKPGGSVRFCRKQS